MSDSKNVIDEIAETPWIFYLFAVLPFVGLVLMIISMILKAINYNWPPLSKASWIVLILLLFWIPAFIMIIVKLIKTVAK